MQKTCHWHISLHILWHVKAAQVSSRRCIFPSVKRHTISVNDCTANTITAPCHFIAAVSLYGIYSSSRYALHDSHMVYTSVISPIKEYDVPCRRNITSVLKLSSGRKPCNTIRTKRKSRYHATVDIATLISAPFYPAVKSIPAPVAVSSIALLCHCHRYNRTAACSRWDSSKGIIP